MLGPHLLTDLSSISLPFGKISYNLICPPTFEDVLDMGFFISLCFYLYRG